MPRPSDVDLQDLSSSSTSSLLRPSSPLSASFSDPPSPQLFAVSPKTRRKHVGGRSSNKTKMEEYKMLMVQMIFLVTGLVSTLGTQWLHYQGAAGMYAFRRGINRRWMGIEDLLHFSSIHVLQNDAQLQHCLTPFFDFPVGSRSLLTVLSTYLGMAAVIFLPPSPSDIPSSSTSTASSSTSSSSSPAAGILSTRPSWMLLGASSLDVLGNIVLTVGMFYVGSGLYQVIYSSVIVFTAFLSACFLSRVMNWGQWMAVMAIMVGLSINAIGNTDVHNAGHEANLTVGFIITLLGTFIYAMVYTVNDYILTKHPTSYPPRKMCIYVGFYCTVITTLIILAVSLETIMQMPLLRWQVFVGYVVLVLSALFHNVTYFELLHGTGAVATGVLQALRAVLVFALSHVMFCGWDEAQCFSAQKGVSTVVVVCGVVGFSVAKASAKKVKVGGAEDAFVRVGTEDEEDVGLDGEEFEDRDSGAGKKDML